MDSDYIQFVRYKLQKRLKRLNSADYQVFHWTLVQTWGFLQASDITKGVLDDLERRCAAQEEAADKTLNGIPQIGVTESENDGICYWVFKKCAQSSKADCEVPIGYSLSHGGNHNDAIEAFRIAFVEPLFDYIDEKIDDKRMTLTLLRKYKHRCEWFHRAKMLAECQAVTRKGEESLAYDLYEYLHDQGIQFHIEPQSESGRIDLISAQSGSDRLVADAKIFNPQGGQDRSYLVKGFRQIYEYTKDYNESFGYLVIFKTCEDDLSISTPHQEAAVPFVTHNNKTIFLVVIDICEYSTSASKRGKLRAHEITPEQLVESLSGSTNPQTA